MSRIAGVLKKAGATRGGAEDVRPQAASPAAANGPATPGDDGRVPWEFEDRRGQVGASRGEAPGDRIVRAAGSRPVVPAPRLIGAADAGWRAGPPPPPPDPPALVQYWDVMRRRWRMAVAILLVVVAGVTAGALLRTPVYRASSLLEIRRESTAAVPVGSLFSSEKVASDDLETQYGILKSHTLAERVVAQVPTDLGQFRQSLVVNPLRGSRLVEVAFIAENAQVAAATVNSVLDTYLQLRMEEAQRTAGWLEHQLQATQDRLEESERQLHAYIRAHGLQVVETGKGEAAQLANERLQALHDALAGAQADRMEKQSADEAIPRLGAARGVDSRVMQDLTIRLADLRREHAKLSSVFHEEYPAVRTLNDQIAELERALAEESQLVVNRGQQQYRAALRKEALLRKALDEQDAVVQALGRQSEGRAGYQSLKRALVTNQEQFAALNQKLEEISISAALKAQNVGVVDRAKPPRRPYGTPLPLTLGLAALVGLVVAGGAVFLREHFDTSMRTVADVESYLGVRTLGAIPAVARVRLAGGGAGTSILPGQWRRIDDRDDPQSPLAEAFATLRNAVLLQEGTAVARVLLITSAQSEEGKTTVSINLALSLARLEYRVLLVDANMRFPCVQRALGLADRPGLVEYLDGGVDWRAARHAQVQPNLDVLAGGEPHASPADLLSLPQMGDLLDAASREYDFVVVDSPALLIHPADVHSLAAVVDNVLLTVRHGWTPREVVALALAQLGRVSGVVLNRSTGPDLVVGRQDVSRRLPLHAAP